MMDNENKSKPGLRLNGSPLAKFDKWRKRPFGYKAVIVNGKYGPIIEYFPDPAHERAEPKE